MNIVIVGAHPDDPEAGCGGLAYKAVKNGHKVTFLYVTNGDKYGKIPEGANLVEVRESEARAAAAYCGAQPCFFGYRDRELAFDPVVLQRMQDFLSEMKADLVLSHWPADLHPDHQLCGVLTTQAVQKLPDTGLAFYEACIGVQTFGMPANRYVDITDVVEEKHKMVNYHVSQSPDLFWRRHEIMHQWHGTNIGVERAEAYYLQKPTKESEEFFALR